MKRFDPNLRDESVDDIEQAAADWLARRYGGLSAEESAAFGAWLSADPRHASAVKEMESAWRVVSSPGAAGQGAIAQERHSVRERHRTRQRRRRATVTTLSFAAAAVLVFAFFPSQWSSSEPTMPLRIVQRPDVRTLPDGSIVQLNAGAEIAPAFTSEKRLVQLVRGEALFVVAKDATRAFVVSAGGVEVKAVGTAFSVRFDPLQVDVLVTEGTVAIERPDALSDSASVSIAPKLSSSGSVLLAAGYRSVVPLIPEISPTVTGVTPAQISAALAWRERRIEFTGTPLAEAVDRFNRQNELQLAIADTRTGAFEISGIFWVNDPESFVRLLETAFDMTADRSGHTVVVRKK